MHRTVKNEILGILVRSTFDETELRSCCLPGNIGPTSNHALFRSLSDAFAHITRLHYPSRQYPMGDSAHIDHGFTWSRSPVLTSYYGERVAKKESEPVSLYALPSDEHLVLLINHFFDTVGMVMPYVSKSDILSEYHRSRQENPRGVSRPMQALLNIICAFASSTLCSGSPEIYYHRALGLLDEKTLRGSSKELSQLNQVSFRRPAVFLIVA